MLGQDSIFRAVSLLKKLNHKPEKTTPHLNGWWSLGKLEGQCVLSLRLSYVGTQQVFAAVCLEFNSANVGC